MTEETTADAAGVRELDAEADAESRIYEVGYLLLPSVAPEEVPREVTAIKDLIEKEGGAVFAEEFPKMRVLAYPMQKRSGGGRVKIGSAYFGWIKFEAAAGAAQRIEAALKQTERVFRFLLIKTVRESTLHVARAPRPEFRRAEKGAPQVVASPPPAAVSDAELEKAVEKIIG